MSQSSEGSQGSEVSRSRSRSRSRTSSPHQDDVKIRLARIFISHDGNIGCEWDGTEPKPGDTLFLYYVEVSDETYNTNIKLDAFRQQHYEKLKKFEANRLEQFPIEKRNFQHLQGKNDNVKCYYIHKVEDERKSNLKETRQRELLPNLMAKGRIFQNKHDLSCWYKLEGPDDYSNDYHMFKEAYDFFDVRVIDDVEEFNKEYIAFTHYVPTKLDAHLLMRETGLSSRRTRTRPRSRSPPPSGGGKTRRKCKVNKRRNRRRRNTMKRRKTTAKRRHR